MKAVLCKQFGPPESLVLEELPSPKPGAGEVVVTVKAASVNFPDVLIIQNKYQFKPPLPFSPGSELAGVVKEVTSDHALRDRGALKSGETLLVLGAAGGVGLAAIEIGKALGAHVIACASSDEKLAVCREHGANSGINYTTEDLRERIKALTQGRGVDVVYDPVGGPYSEPAFRSLAWRGRLLVVGFAAGEIPKLPLNLALLKGASVVGVFWGDFARREPKAFAGSVSQLARWYGEGKLRPHVSQTMPLERAADAIKLLASRQAKGKIVLTMGA